MQLDWAHLHLALNHIPVLGTLFVFLLMLSGWIKRSDVILRMSLWWWIALTLIAIPIKFTGDYAFETLANAPWMSETRAMAHEQAADQATTAIFLAGISATIGVWFGRRGRTIPRWIYALTGGLALITFVLMIRTANLGGKLRHDELRGLHQQDGLIDSDSDSNSDPDHAHVRVTVNHDDDPRQFARAEGHGGPWTPWPSARANRRVLNE